MLKWNHSLFPKKYFLIKFCLHVHATFAADAEPAWEETRRLLNFCPAHSKLLQTFFIKIIFDKKLDRWNVFQCKDVSKQCIDISFYLDITAGCLKFRRVIDLNNLLGLVASQISRAEWDDGNLFILFRHCSISWSSPCGSLGSIANIPLQPPKRIW